MSGHPAALTIAGSDSSGGAGIQADLKTFTVLGVYGATVVTAITAQNTRGVQLVQVLSPEIVGAQMDSVLSDLTIDAAKTGMLGSEGVVKEVSKRLRDRRPSFLVIDPVMRSKSGHVLLERDAVESLKTCLFPLATIVTPNIPEAELLTGSHIEDLEGMRRAGRYIRSFGPEWVVVKGGHLLGDAVDVITDGHGFWEVSHPRVKTTHTHGSGCAFSAAIAAFLARGFSPKDSIEEAKRFISFAIERAVPIVQGQSPPNHLSYLGKGGFLEELRPTREGK